MAREKEGYRPLLELIQQTFPGKSVLTMTEVERFCRCNRRTLFKDKAFPIRMIGGRYIIAVTDLARYLCA